MLFISDIQQPQPLKDAKCRAMVSTNEKNRADVYQLALPCFFSLVLKRFPVSLTTVGCDN